MPLTIPLTPAAYLDNIVSTVNAYKDARDTIEKMFDLSPGLPDSSVSPISDTSLSDKDNLKKKREIYHWSTENNYPPHLYVVPTDEVLQKEQIFQADRLAQVSDMQHTVPKFFSELDKGGPGNLTMASIEQRYKDLHQAATAAGLKDVYAAPNIGLREDWYTDAVFAQQHLTGVNPTGLKQASEDWIAAFSQAAADQKNTGAQQILAGPASALYVVDNTDYRYILGIGAKDPIIANGVPIPGVPAGQPAHGCASVTLFTLTNAGKLHPVAICLDFKNSIQESVTVFNKRLTHDAQGVNEKEDWPWRYAKMCSSMSDWLRHELTIHLTETHLIEEGIIVAAQRNLPDSHIIYQLLHPHWYKTMSLNFLARLILVPTFIEKVAPLELDQIKYMIRQSYNNFDFTGRYAPTELKSRGFDPCNLDDPKFHNYLYARNISKCWDVLRSFVSDVLCSAYPLGDISVRADKYLAGFCAEMRSLQGAQLTSFPLVKTREELIDAITMCIHIASPQHNAINYLQQFYLSFVPNRPGSFAAPVATTLAEVQGYTEASYIAALPIGGFADRVEWMLMSQVPFLLSAEVDPESNIEEYAASTTKSPNPHIAKAGLAFSKNIKALKGLFDQYDKQKDDQVTAYHVLDPKVMAQSILI